MDIDVSLWTDPGRNLPGSAAVELRTVHDGRTIPCGIIHRFSWSVVSHLFYPLQRHETITKHKTLVTCGLALIVFSLKGGDFLEFAAKLVGAGWSII